MVGIKPLGEIADKFITVTPQRAPFYKTGVERSGVDWEANTAASEAAYEAGVQAAIARKAFGSGVRLAGNDKWRRKSSEVGAGRFGPGVTASKEDYQSGFAPYHSTIANITLPTRGARGDPANIQRVAVLAEALHRQRVGA